LHAALACRNYYEPPQQSAVALGSHTHREMIEIESVGLLEAMFGHWPDFHDAELRAVRLEARSGLPPSLELEIEVAETSSEVDERGLYRDRHRCLATFRFGNVLNVRLDGFRYQNVLDALQISELAPMERAGAGEGWGERRYRVVLIPIPAFAAMDFLCDSVAVLSVSPVARAT
jgi:hypothetical protein